MSDNITPGQNPGETPPNPAEDPANSGTNPQIPPGENDQKPGENPGEVAPGDEGEENKTFSYAYVKTLREEAKTNRIKADNATKDAKTLKDKVDAFERDKLTEDEKLKADLNKYANELVPQKDKQIRSLQVQVQASKLGIVDPEAAEKLIDWNAIDATDSTAVEQALSDLITSKPWLKKTETDGKPPKVTSSTSPANPSSSNNATKKFTRADLQKMTPDEINKLYSEGGLKEALEEGRVTQE